MNTKDNKHRDALIALGPERLADLILGFASFHEDVRDAVLRLSTGSREASDRVRRRLAEFGRDPRFLTGRESDEFARELQSVIADIEAAAVDPAVGLELVVTFYEHDEAIFNFADDSSGVIGNVLRYDLRHLFERYARQLGNEQRVMEVVLDLLRDDGYGVRDAVLEDARAYLSERSIRDLVAEFHERATAPRRGHSKWVPGEHLALSLAEQLADPELYESIVRTSGDGKLGPGHCIKMAELSLSNGDAKAALAWAERISADRGQAASERDGLLLRIHLALGETEAASEIAWSSFRRNLTTSALDTLVSVIGEDERELAIDEAVAMLERKNEWFAHDAIFLMEIDRLDAAEAHVLRLAPQIDGDYYGAVLGIAEPMEDEGRYLCASVLYRPLLESILRRAQSRYYHHGARYLKKLDALAKKVDDWKDIETHRDYRAGLEERHARKYAFWRRFE